MSLNDEIQQQQTIVLDYTNHRGIRSTREVIPLDIYFGSNEWHPEPQWLLKAFDAQENGLRDFAMAGIHGFNSVEQAASKGGARP